MKTILLLFAMVTIAHAQIVTENRLKTVIGVSNSVINTRIAASESTNAVQALAIAAAHATNAAQTVTNSAQDSAIAAANATNATQATAIAAANTTNAAQQVKLDRSQNGSITLSNFVAYLQASGVTNISAGTNVVLYVSNGALIINSSAGSLSTNHLPVIQVTNLLAQSIDTDTFNVGVLIPTNVVYVANTNTTSGNGTNFVADFNQSEQVITVTNAVNFVHGTNLWGAPTNAYLAVALMNFSGANQTLAIPAAWKESLNFPTVITNGTILELTLKNYGGLSQTNIRADADQY